VDPPARNRLGTFERLGAWLGLWTPPRGVVVPPPPWRAIGIGAALVLALAGTALAIAVPRISERREADRERQVRVEAERHARFLASVDREQAPRRGAAAAAPRDVEARTALVAAAAAAIARDAERRSGEDIEGPAQCEPFPRTLAGPDPARDRSRRAAEYNCIAITARFGGEEQAGGRGVIGVQFRLVADFRTGRYAYCRIVPLGDRDRLSHPLPEACRLEHR
jgi:hypothetical protein